MDFLGIGSAVQGIGNIVNAFTQRQTARENTDKTIQANKQMAEYQYSKDVEMWNKGNTYNSPMAQMERLKSAGLNPNLVYGNGAQASSAGQLPKYNAPTLDYNYKPLDFGAIGSGANQGISAYQDIQLKNAQLDNLRAQRAALNQQTINNQVNEGLLRNKSAFSSDSEYQKWQGLIRDNQMKGQKIQYLPSLWKTQLAGLEQQNKNLADQNAMIIANTENKKLQNEYFLGTNFGGLGLNALKSLGGVGKFFLGNKDKALKATKPALRVNPNNWPKFKH
ncbi:MAG: DNA pilot protein [Microvirus sp.]|nr:MAG: DNA pilot protein [Microvirus sp.]